MFLPKNEQIATQDNFFIDQFVQNEDTMASSHSLNNFTHRIHNQIEFVDTTSTQDSKKIQCKI